MKFPKGSNMKTPFLWNPFKKTTTTKSRVFPQTPGVHVFPWECLLNREAPTDVIPSPEKLGPDPKSSTFDKVGPEPILVKWSEMGPLLVTGRRRPILKDVLQKTQTRKRGINVLYIIIYIYISTPVYFFVHQVVGHLGLTRCFSKKVQQTFTPKSWFGWWWIPWSKVGSQLHQHWNLWTEIHTKSE